MKKLSVLSIFISVLFVLTLPLMAQAPDVHHMYAHPLVQPANVPQNPSTPTGIPPMLYKEAYGFNRIPNQGAGMTIAVISAYDDPNIASDLAFYASYFHLTPCNLTVVDLATIEGGGFDLLSSLGVEQACALAPQANIVLVEATSNSVTDLLDAVALASQPPYNATVVSIPWGVPEFEGEQYDSFCNNIVNGNGQPVMFVAAEGPGCGTVYYPAALSCVVAVGSTTLALSSALPPSNPLQLDYGMETAYGGGGLSQFVPQPPWQNPACSQYSTTYRCVPDVAADGNPATGVPVYDTYSYSGWVQVGGASVPTSDWAAFFTLVNSQRVLNGEITLSEAGPDMYAIYYSPYYLNNFNDITQGGSGECQAGPGYDLATGIGSYKANALSTSVVADPN